MALLVPMGGFAFALGVLAARGEDWIGPGSIAALGFAAMVWTWALIMAN